MNGQRELRAFEGGGEGRGRKVIRGRAGALLYSPVTGPKTVSSGAPCELAAQVFFTVPRRGTFNFGMLRIHTGGTSPGIGARVKVGQCEGGQELGT